MRVPPGNGLEALQGDRAGQFSIRINDPYRICFVDTAAGPADVEIPDDHLEAMAMATELAPRVPWRTPARGLLKPMGASQYRLAKGVGVQSTRICEIVAGRRSITADTDLRLWRFFGRSQGYRLRARVANDTEVANERLAGERDTPVRRAHAGPTASAIHRLEEVA